LTEDIRTELHFHLLPGVDDGPETLEESLELARLAVADGTSVVVCTPHVHLVDVATVPARVQELQSALDAARIPLKVRPGGEITPGTDVSAADLRVLAQGPPGRTWVLLEAPLMGRPVEELHEQADELEARGHRLLIGHPERCSAFMAADGGLDHRLRQGALLQVNASSLMGVHGADARAAGLDLVRRGLVSVIASDAHRPSRPPRLSEAVAMLAEHGIDGTPLTDVVPERLLSQGLEPERAAA
jgi:protein-tyrosine phosphatase